MALTQQDAVETEIENERLENAITKLHEASAGVTAVNADAIVTEAERQTVMDLLIRAGVCTKKEYITEFDNNIREAIGGLAESGLIDITATIDDEASGD